jgi:hypothetical protein
MPHKRTRFGIGAPDGKPREILSVVQKANGDLIIPISGTGLAQPGDLRVADHRYSVHASSLSPEYTTIKQTLRLEDGTEQTSALLTDAVKKESGFSIISVRRCQNLAGEPPIRTRTSDILLSYPSYDPKQFTLFSGLYIGSKNVAFNAQSEFVSVASFVFSEFRLVITLSLEPYPSDEMTELLHSVTVRPELSANDQGRALLRFLMAGRSPEDCLLQHAATVAHMSKTFLEMKLPGLDDPNIIARVKADIAAYERIKTTTFPLEPDKGLSLVGLETRGSLPIP